MVSSIRARAFGMAIGLSGGWERPRLTAPVGRVLLECEQMFAPDLEQAGFDRAGTTKSPQQACESMNERKLQHGSRINAGDEGALERSEGANIFDNLNDGLVSKPITPSAAA